MIAILGGGIAGISAGYHLYNKGVESTVYEQRDSYGGLCDNFKLDGFRFDHAVHFSHTKNEYVKQLFSKSTNYFTHEPLSSNFYHGYWLKHPVQNNLYPLPVEQKVKIITDFIKREKQEKFTDYEKWLRYQYGNEFAEMFPLTYTKKYWTVNASQLTTDWIGNRMYRPNIEEVLTGAMSSETADAYYASEMRYPVKGGYKAFIEGMARYCTFQLEHRASYIDPKNKIVEFENGKSISYDFLISSLPLPEIIKIIKDCPKKVREAAECLSWTSIGLVSLGFKVQVPKHLWFYIYDEDILPSRAYSPSLKSAHNAPKNKSSLQFEVYFSKYKHLQKKREHLIEHVVDCCKKMNICKPTDIIVSDYRELKYGNVIFDKHRNKSKKIIQEYLQSVNIESIGRFGEWDYLWSDQSLLSGMGAADRIFNKVMEEGHGL